MTSPPRLRRRPSRATRRLTALLAVEHLEARQLLSTVSWNTDASGSWFDATKWSTGTVPAAGDDVVIDRGAANPVVTFGGRDYTVQSLTVKDTLEVASGNLSLGASSRIDGTLTLDGGVISPAADTALTLAGSTAWTSGGFAGDTTLNTGTMTLSGSSPKNIYGGATLANTGTIADASTDPANGYLFLTGTLDIRAGGVFDLQGDTNIYGGTNFYGNRGTGIFKNAGTVRKSAGSGTSTINGAVGFDNLGGTVDVRTGTLSLATEETSLSTGGTFIVAAGSVLDLTSPQHPTYTGTYTGSGGGTVVLGPTGYLNAGSGATFNFPAGMFQWTGGNIEGMLTNTGTITLSATQTRLSDLKPPPIACGVTVGCILARAVLRQTPQKSCVPTSATVTPPACP